MGSRGRVGAAIAALCVTFAISGCGDDENGGDRPDRAELLDHVPSVEGGALAYADFATAKEQLGLPEDADVADFTTGDDPANVGRERLADTAAWLLHYLTNPQPTPLRKAIDHGAIGAAANNVDDGGSGVSVIRTSQSFDDIARALGRSGYERDGDVLESKSPPGPSRLYRVLADAGDGVIVLGFERRAVEDAVAGSAGSDNLARALLEGVDGVARGSIATVVDSTSLDCVRGLAVGESFDRETADLRIEIDGEASADRFRLPELRERPRLEYGEPEVEGGVLTVEIVGGRDPDVPGVELPLDLLTAALKPSRIYEC
jgi:hypothetical protein